MTGKAACELCGAPAAVHCDADDASLCLRCDSRVHGANFLVARHIRRPIRLDATPSPSSSSDSCISVAESSAEKQDSAPSCQIQARAERVLEWWSRRLGLGRRCAAVAARVLMACAGRMTSLPFRAGLAAALLFAVKACGGGGVEEAVKRLEGCSGVPAKLIVVAESRLARVARRVDPRFNKEGSGECS